MKEQLTLFREDSHANHSALLESGKEKMMNATCGTKCLEQYKRLNPNSSSLKTSMVSSILMAEWYSNRCALTWKLKGTKFSRLLFQLVPKTLHTDEIDAGLSPTVKTFDATVQRKLDENGKNISKTSGKSYGVHLTQMAESGILPTPKARDWKGEGFKNDLPTMLLTPSASDGMRSGMTMDSLKRHNKPNAEKSNLAEQIAHRVGGGTSHLNPRFVAEMMGFPVNWTELPFQNGETNPSKDTETQ